LNLCLTRRPNFWVITFFLHKLCFGRNAQVENAVYLLLSTIFDKNVSILSFSPKMMIFKNLFVSLWSVSKPRKLPKQKAFLAGYKRKMK
jgi:hypothetical protein